VRGIWSAVRLVASLFVGALVLYGVLAVIGQSGRAGGVEVLLAVPFGVLAAVATWRRSGRMRIVATPPDNDGPERR